MRLPGPKKPKNWQNLHRVAKLGLGVLLYAIAKNIPRRKLMKQEVNLIRASLKTPRAGEIEADTES
jgi:hypothetical protein